MGYWLEREYEERIKMRYQPIEKLSNAYWYSFSDEPILARGALRLCDPAYLLPEESPDGLWHMFAHTAIGLEHLTSTSGLEWTREHVIVYRGHSPFIYKERDTYYLFYEIHSKTSFFKKDVNNLSVSRIMVICSTDLLLWSEPRMVLDSTKITRAQYKNGPIRVSRPQIVEMNGGYRLYFGAGETRLYDTKQKATARLMYAQSDYLDGDYRVNPEPILDIEPDGKYRNLATGSVHIVKCSDGVAAFECAFSYDEERKRSVTNLLLLTSSDGSNFTFNKIIQKSPKEGWASRYMTSVDVRFKESENSWYCYYSANGYVNILGHNFVKESLGLLLGTDATKN